MTAMATRGMHHPFEGGESSQSAGTVRPPRSSEPPAGGPRHPARAPSLGSACSPCSRSHSPSPRPCARPGRRAVSRCCRRSPRSPSGAGATASPSPPTWFVVGSVLGGATLGGVTALGALALDGVSTDVALAVAGVARAGRRRDRRRRRRRAAALLQAAARRRLARPLPGLGVRAGLRLADRRRLRHLHHDDGRPGHGPPRRAHRQPGGRRSLVGLAFGLVRGLAILGSAPATTTAALGRLHQRFEALEAPVRQATVVALGDRRRRGARRGVAVGAAGRRRGGRCRRPRRPDPASRRRPEPVVPA